MYFKRNAGKGEIIKALLKLKPGDPESFLTVDLNGEKYDSIQAIRNEDSSYHVELLRKGGNPKIFSGNRIFACAEITQEAAIKLFLAMLMRRDALPMPKAAKEITVAAANARQQ